MAGVNRSAEEIRKEIGVALEIIHEVACAGLGFHGDSALHILRCLRDDKPLTDWGGEVMRMIEEVEGG